MWDRNVVPAALELAQTTLPALSGGFRHGLVAITAGFWVNALGRFASVLLGFDLADVFWLFFSALFPLFLAGENCWTWPRRHQIATAWLQTSLMYGWPSWTLQVRKS